MRKTFAWFSAVLVAVAASFALASPAQADEEDCPEVYTGGNSIGYVCLWKWVGFEGGRWQQRMDTLADLPASGSRPAGCWNFSGSTFGSPHAGQPVNNESASLVFEQDSLPFYVYLYDWVDCQPSSLLYARNGQQYTALTNLGAPTSPCSCYHKFTSIKVVLLN